MTRDRAIMVGVVVGAIAAALQAWWLWTMIGFGFWFLALVVPMCLMTMQVVGGTAAKFLMSLGD
ncbi:MAG: hypothetical protein AAF799_37065 [Myxococcota bacterium]